MTDLRPAEPRWVRDIFIAWIHELRSFFATAAAFIRAPRRFGAEWSTGELRAMNPVGFVLASATALLPLDYGVQRTLGWDTRPDVNMAIEIARAMRPFAFAILTGIACHVVLKLLRTRGSVAMTVAVFLYSATFAWALWCVGLLICLVTRADNWLPGVIGVLALPWMALALEGVHRIRWWWCLAVTIATGWVAIQVVRGVLRVAGLT